MTTDTKEVIRFVVVILLLPVIFAAMVYLASQPAWWTP